MVETQLFCFPYVIWDLIILVIHHCRSLAHVFPLPSFPPLPPISPFLQANSSLAKVVLAPRT